MNDTQKTIIECFEKFNKPGRYTFLNDYFVNNWCGYPSDFSEAMSGLLDAGIIEPARKRSTYKLAK